MTRETYIAIALAVLGVWLLIRHVRKLLHGDAGGCGCCKGVCRPGTSTQEACPGAINLPDEEASPDAPSPNRSATEPDDTQA